MKKTFIAVCIALLTGFVQTANAYPLAEVRMTGSPPELADTLKNLTGILAGDEYDKNRTMRAEEKLSEFLETKGYPQSTIEASVLDEESRRVLLFNIDPGPALRINSISFNFKNQKTSEGMLRRLTRAVDLKPQELFDRDRIKEMRRSIESSLFARNYIDSRVENITTESSPDGLKLVFWVELGQKVVLSVSGNEYFARSELVSLMDDQRAAGLGHDYIAVLSARIHDHYVDQGFRSVKITPYVFEAHGNEDKKVVFDIDEGPRVRIKQLIFDGNETFSNNELKDLFYDTAPDRIVARIYNEKMADEAARSMMDAIKRKGYLSAKLIAIKTEEVDDAHINLRIFLSEGLQTRIQVVDFHGNHLFTAEQLDTFLGLKEGDPLNLIQLEDGIDRIKREYRNKGFLNFKVNNEAGNQLVSYSEKNQFAYLSFDLSEGHLIKLGRYEIFGNDITKRHIIDRELTLKEGDPLAETKTTETEEHLRRLGIFNQVNLEFKDSSTEPDTKDMKISVQESTPGNTSGGIGFRNDLGIRVFGEVAYSNLWGENHTWALDATANRRITGFHFTEYSAALSYTWPWALLGDTTFRPALSTEKRQYIQFDAETFAFSANLERALYRPWKLSGVLNYTLEHVKEFDNITDPTQNQEFLIGSITPTLRLDLRDNPLVPRSGVFILSSFEYANTALGSQKDPPISYGRFQFRGDFYVNAIPHLVWFSSIRGGWLKNFTNPYNADGSLNPAVGVPLIKQFALGGINSLRGFTEQEITLQTEGGPQLVSDYETYVNYRTQLDFFTSQNLSIGPFLDAGNLQGDAFSLGNLRYGTGLGLRYLTPIGPVNFDWGFKLFPQPGENSNVFYFSLGVI